MVVIYVSSAGVSGSLRSPIQPHLYWHIWKIMKLPENVYDENDFTRLLVLLGLNGRRVAIASNSKKYHGFSCLAKGRIKDKKFIGDCTRMKKYFSWNRYMASHPKWIGHERQCAKCGWWKDVRLYSVESSYKLLCLKCASKFRFAQIVEHKPRKKRVGLKRRVVNVGSPLDFTDFTHATTYYAEDVYEEDDEDDYEEGYEVW